MRRHDVYAVQEEQNDPVSRCTRRNNSRECVRCLHTGQNQPLAFLFLRGVVSGAGCTKGMAGAAGTASAGAPSCAASCAPSAGVSPAGVAAASSGASAVASSACTICPPAPNSIMLIAHSRHATRWRHGSSTTSRGAERHRRHSDEGSSSYVGAAGVLVGGYVVGNGTGGGAEVLLDVEFERPYISWRWKVWEPICDKSGFNI